MFSFCVRATGLVLLMCQSQTLGYDGIKLNNWRLLVKKVFAFAAACGLALSAQASCYSVYSDAGRLIHQSSDAPVDTTYPYHLTVPLRFGLGATLVYVADSMGCSPAGIAPETPMGKSGDSVFMASVLPLNTDFDDVSVQQVNGRGFGLGGGSSYGGGVGSGSRALHTGPLGGIYSVTSRGNKSYVGRGGGGGGGRRR